MAKYYHVSTGIFREFCYIEQAIAAYSSGIQPRVPEEAGDGEDDRTPRVCLAPSIEKCLTALGVCTGPHRHMPLLVCEVELDAERIYIPKESEVPDVAITGEVWSLEEVIPDRVYVVWISENSIEWESIDWPGYNGEYRLCTSVEFMSEDLVDDSYMYHQKDEHPLDQNLLPLLLQ